MSKQTVRQAVTAGQIKYLHSLYRAMGWDEETYRFVLSHDFGVTSTSLLSLSQAGELIALLKGMLTRDQQDMATPKQCGLIRYMWKEIDYSRGEKGDLHLNAFLVKKFQRSRVEYLSKGEAIRVIKMIQQMTKQAEKRAGKTTVLHRHAQCLYCGRPIMWVQLADGRRVCFDFNAEADFVATDFHECDGGSHES